MVTNTYAPHVGGVARSVVSFSEEFRRRGHRVMVMAPMFGGAPEREPDVIRIRALQNFNGSDFSVAVMPPLHVSHAVDAFRPDVIHSHHPFLLGSTAVRLAKSRGVPLVFTHHTLYERYTHYVPGDSAAMKRFIIRLSTNYANLAARVFAPSESVARLLRERDVTVPIKVVPTGVDLPAAPLAAVIALRQRLGIAAEALVAGTVGRLAEEKNLGFLCRALVRFLSADPAAHALIVGDGPAAEEMRAIFAAAGVAGRAHFTGTLQGEALAAAYAAMDAFAFASLTETQGLVLAEAMGAGVPVVALDASGARDIVREGVNGRLLRAADEAGFAAALGEVATGAFAEGARATGETLSIRHAADLALDEYRALRGRPYRVPLRLRESWKRGWKFMRAEMQILSATTGAATAAFQRETPEEAKV